MVLIDYKGYRVIAISKLPIDSKTLRYGLLDSSISPISSSYFLICRLE